MKNLSLSKWIAISVFSLLLTTAFGQSKATVTWSAFRQTATTALATLPTVQQIQSSGLSATIKKELIDAITAWQTVLQYQTEPPVATLAKINKGLNEFFADNSAEAKQVRPNPVSPECDAGFRNCLGGGQTECDDATDICQTCLKALNYCRMNKLMPYPSLQEILQFKAPNAPTKIK